VRIAVAGATGALGSAVVSGALDAGALTDRAAERRGSVAFADRLAQPRA
jgi:hypothetical protein